MKPVHYEISANVLTAKARLEADCRIKLLNPSRDQIGRVRLLLNKGLKATSVTSQNRNVKFTQKQRRFSDLEGFEVNLVEAQFDRTLKPRRKAWIRIAYEGVIKGYDDVFRYTRDRISEEYSLIRPDVYSYPVVGVPEFKKLVSATPMQRFSYRLDVTVPTGFVVANVGRLVGTRQAGNVATYIYESKLPSWRIDIAIARFKHYAETDAAMHVYALSEDSAHSERIVNELRRCRDFYRDWFGEPRSWAGYTVIEIPEGWGSQADVCGMLLNSQAFRDAESVGGLYHELAHLWNAQSGEEVPSRFLDEGFASYFQLLAEKEFSGEPRFQKRMERVRQRLVEMAGKNPLLLKAPISDYGKLQLTDASYPVGAWILFILHSIVGNRCFKKIVRTFLERFSEKPATLMDFRKVVTEICGRQLEEFINSWLFENRAATCLEKGFSAEQLKSVYGISSTHKSE
jgi:hypothetical protein